MHEKLIREINGEIADALLARKMPFAPSRKAALALLKVPGWTEGLEQMLPIRGRLECAHVLELCSCVLPRLAPRPEEGWLAFCTQYGWSGCTPVKASPLIGRSMRRGPCFSSLSFR